MEQLQAAAPIRGIIGTIRNIADFGAFIDFGGPNDGLLHTSKLGPLKLSNLLIGQELGVDVLQVDNRRVSLGVSGLNLEPNANRFATSRSSTAAKQRKSGSKRSLSTKASSAKRRRK
jgi:ribosomal protein S1